MLNFKDFLFDFENMGCFGTFGYTKYNVLRKTPVNKGKIWISCSLLPPSKKKNPRVCMCIFDIARATEIFNITLRVEFLVIRKLLN